MVKSKVLVYITNLISQRTMVTHMLPSTQYAYYQNDCLL